MIRFDHVGKTYPDGTVAVADFSLEIASHEVIVLLGSSGCGKTTLLRMVNRMVDPSSGSVWIDEENVADIDRVALRRRIGYVMQSGGLLPHRTVLDNVGTVPTLLGQDRREVRRRALELLELVGLGDAVAQRYPSQLSGGQRQRVGVARALAADPNILLMDEPFGAVPSTPWCAANSRPNCSACSRNWPRPSCSSLTMSMRPSCSASGCSSSARARKSPSSAPPPIFCSTRRMLS